MHSHNDHNSLNTHWTLFLAGDSQALDVIVKTHFNLLYQYGCKFTADHALVKDCIQDLFLFLWQRREAIQETPVVKAYLMKALRRRLERAWAKTTAIERNFEFQSPPDHSREAEIITAEQHAELSQQIKKGIALLSKRQQEIIYLRFYLNADAAQIADIMQLNRQSVYNLLHDAINKLRSIGEAFFKQAISTSSLLLILSVCGL
jgi:RNA polymerase sigma factor (sigma-70 family)